MFVELEGDRDIIQTIYKHRGVVYGGYIRDVVRGVKPNDIDVVISAFYSKAFFDDPLIKTYKSNYNPENMTCILTKKNHRKIELYTVEDHPDDTLLGPISDPDYDVNTLVSTAGTLSIWTGSTQSINDLIGQIKRGEARELNYDPRRRTKILERGFKIVG